MRVATKSDAEFKSLLSAHGNEIADADICRKGSIGCYLDVGLVIIEIRKTRVVGIVYADTGKGGCSDRCFETEVTDFVFRRSDDCVVGQ